MNFGIHLTIDGYKGDAHRLDDMLLVFNSLNELPEKLGMKKLNPPYVVSAPSNAKKDPGGFSGFVMIAESHISIHTFPKKRFVSIDIYTCKNRLPEKIVLNYFKKTFKLEETETHLIKRGLKFPRNNLV
jgi:S-adenosylmethionine decarboxylase